MKNVSNEFINKSKKVKVQDLKLTINDGEQKVQEVHFLPVNVFNLTPINILKARNKVIAKELKYSFDGQLFKTIMKQIEITVKNAREIKGKNINFQYGILINNEFEYVDLGDYYIKDVEDDKNKEELVVTGYDKMLNFMTNFKQSELQLTYPCKLSQLLQRMGEVCGVELYSTNFFNSDLTVEEDFFTAQELTYRDVLEKIAEVTLTTIFIKENKLYLHKVEESVQTLDTSFLSNLVIDEKFGPINALVIGRGSVEDNIESSNQESINTFGRCEIKFDENELVDSKRNNVIDLMFKQIDGLEYYSFQASNLGVMWLEPCDVIIVKDREGNEYKTIYLYASVTINSGIKGEMLADIPETTTTEYKVTTKEQKKILKTERLAKKNEGLIKDLIEETTEHSEKLSIHQQTIDSITDTVSNMQEVTNEVEGIKEITLENCTTGDLLELHIYGNNEVFKHLYPSDTLLPFNDLLPYGDSRIIVTDEIGVEKTYELGVLDVLRRKGDVCDEFVLENSQAKVIRRINSDGTIKTKETIEELGLLRLELNKGTNKIKIKNYSASLKAKYVIVGDYTDLFATKVEMTTNINQKVNEINLKVEEKLDEKEFTGANIVLAINNDSSSATIKADKISLNGKEIDLTSEDISIVSDTLKINKNGTMELIGKESVANLKLMLKDNVERYVTLNPTQINFINEKYGHRIFMYNAPSGALLNLISNNHEIKMFNNGDDIIQISVTNGIDTSIITSEGIATPSVTQTSREEQKKNFEKLENGLEIVKNTEIYQYNLKSQNDDDKKHIGFVIGENYKYANEITAVDKDGNEVGVDTYSMISVSYKAIQELHEIIEQLQERIEELEGK